MNDMKIATYLYIAQAAFNVGKNIIQIILFSTAWFKNATILLFYALFRICGIKVFAIVNLKWNSADEDIAD